uniref:Coiled-coil domain-containing protein 191 n=1 Tax=Pogona vitticeps TaxID=103695 RepID=A0ABM5FX22_9SAUR
MAVMRPRTELYRWRRFTQPSSRQKKKIDADSVEHWIKQVEAASEFAVAEVFSFKKTHYFPGLRGPLVDLETTEQLLDHDEAYVEAQELLSDWMNSKLKLELTSDQEDDTENGAVCSVPPQEPPAGFQKYDRFDDLYSYLEEELEDTTVQDFLQHLLQSEVISNGILEDLQTEDLKEKKKARDPRITMELRHKQVKENRLKRQKELELLKQEKVLKKAAMSEAQKQLQEEKKKKVLKAKREDEEIQKQMVKLRKELIDRRHLMEEIWKMGKKKHNFKKVRKLVGFGLPPNVSAHLDCEKEEQRKEKQIKIQEFLNKVEIANRQCLQKYFFAWYKLVLDLRIKMGKARALADWKCQLRTLRAWRDYTWSQKMEQEAEKMENQLRDQNRKKQLATEFNRKCTLRHFFAEWQSWSRTEAEKRDIELKKEKTKRKMATLLEEVMLGKAAAESSWNAERLGKKEEAQGQPLKHSEVAEIPLLHGEPPSAKHKTLNSGFSETNQKCSHHFPKKPKWAWQVTQKHAALNAQDRAMFGNQMRNSLQHLGMARQKMAPAFCSSMEHCHDFQQQLIEEQRQQLQEQQQLILKLQENVRLKMGREETEEVTADILTLNNHSAKARERKESNLKNTELLRSENRQSAAPNQKNLKVVSAPHPLLKAMEERAVQRAERRKELEEAKKKREEEKLAQMQAEEEERQRREAAEKEAQLEKRREERKLQKIKELEKQKRLDREQQLFLKATEHYNKVLVKKQGLEPWKKLIKQSQENMVVAQKHHFFRLQKKYLLAWLHHMQEILAGKIAQAEKLHSCLLLRRSFRIWVQYKDAISTMEQNATKHHEASLKRKVFWAWFDIFSEEKSVLWEKQKTADQYSDRRIMLTAFGAWRQFPRLMKEEREKEERLQQLRKKVSEILPDFQT